LSKKRKKGVPNILWVVRKRGRPLPPLGTKGRKSVRKKEKKKNGAAFQKKEKKKVTEHRMRREGSPFPKKKSKSGKKGGSSPVRFTNRKKGGLGKPEVNGKKKMISSCGEGGPGKEKKRTTPACPKTEGEKGALGQKPLGGRGERGGGGGSIFLDITRPKGNTLVVFQWEGGSTTLVVVVREEGKEEKKKGDVFAFQKKKKEKGGTNVSIKGGGFLAVPKRGGLSRGKELGTREWGGEKRKGLRTRREKEKKKNTTSTTS